MCLQLTSYCITWIGEGDATAGTRQFASDIEFFTDIDEQGVELVGGPSEDTCTVGKNWASCILSLGTA